MIGDAVFCCHRLLCNLQVCNVKDVASSHLIEKSSSVFAHLDRPAHCRTSLAALKLPVGFARAANKLATRVGFLVSPAPSLALSWRKPRSKSATRSPSIDQGAHPGRLERGKEHVLLPARMTTVTSQAEDRPRRHPLDCSDTSDGQSRSHSDRRPPARWGLGLCLR